MAWHFECLEIEPFLEEATEVAYRRERERISARETAQKRASDALFSSNTCKEGLIWIDTQTAVAEKYFTKEEYFNIWDTQNVNPYEYKLTDFKDTVAFRLFDREQGKLWASPLARETKVNSQYGPRWYRWHHGVDLKLDIGDPVRSVFDGVVRIAKYNRGGYGYYVVVRHENGLETLYAHLSQFTVHVGDELKAGDMVGYGGNTGRSTGPHLHFEVRYRGHAFDPRHMFDFHEEGGRLYFRDFVLTPFHYRELQKETKGQYHRIRNGDSLWVISQRYRTPIQQLCRLNGISRNTVLQVGKVLRVR